MAPDSSQQLLQKLMTETETSVSRLESAKSEQHSVELEVLQRRMDETAQMKDTKERDIRMRVIEADINKLRAEVQQEEKDLAQAVFGLNAIVEEMGSEYDSLTKLNASEQNLISSSEAHLAQSNASLVKAQGKWFFRQSAIAKANAAIATSTQKIADAKVEAKRLARQRLLSANMEESLQQFMHRVEKTIQIMEKRIQDISGQLASVAARKKEAFAVKEEAAKALKSLDEKLVTAEAELKREEEELVSLVNGTPEHAEQTKTISNLRAKVEDIRGRRNTALILFQSKEKFAAEHEIHERSQMKLRDNALMFITALRSDTEERVVTFRSRLEAMKAMSDQEIAKNLDKIGAAIDQANAEYMAAAGSASDRVRMEKVEAHPARLAKMMQVQEAQAEAVQAIRLREWKAIEEFKKNYGIDPTRSSFFHYVKDEDTAPAEKK